MPSVDVNKKRNDPNAKKELVDFWNEKDIYSNKNNILIPLAPGESGSHQGYSDPKKDIIIPIGKSEDGYVLFDFNFGYNLIAGGNALSGAGMFRRTSLLHLIKEYSPDKVKIILLDTIKQMEDFDNIPHLLFPRATKEEDCIKQLDWCLKETDRRYNFLIEEKSYTNIRHYNEHEKDILPDIFIFISELGDIINMKSGLNYIIKMVQLTRAFSVHFIITTQRPGIETMGELIKENFFNRIAFQMPYRAESELFIGQAGAEELLGQGDMLFKDGYNNKVLHLQGLHFSVEETKDTVKKLIENKL
jgi:S-DNA-T family DNA segregation ATPase FtsK/SpoIIIE